MTLSSKIVKSQNIRVSGNVITLKDRRYEHPALVAGSQPIDQAMSDQGDDPAQADLQHHKNSLMLQNQLIEKEKIRLQAQADWILSEARNEAWNIKNLAYKDGYAAGNQALVKDIVQCIQDVDKAMSDLEKLLNQFTSQYEKDLFALAVTIASKVLCQRISQDDEAMAELIHHAVDSVKNADWISVEVAESMGGYIKTLNEELQNSVRSSSVDITMKDAAPGFCIIKTPHVVLDASISTQLENLKRQFNVS